MPSRADIVAEARTWLGTPYEHRGRRKGHSVDCVGIIIGVGRALGLADYHRRDYKPHPDPDRMGADLRANLEEFTADEPLQFGDIAWFIVRQDPQHLGVIGDYPEGGFSLIHAHSTCGRAVEHRLDDRWRKRIHRIFRYRGVA